MSSGKAYNQKSQTCDKFGARFIYDQKYRISHRNFQPKLCGITSCNLSTSHPSKRYVWRRILYEEHQTDSFRGVNSVWIIVGFVGACPGRLAGSKSTP